MEGTREGNTDAVGAMNFPQSGKRGGRVLRTHDKGW